MNGFTTGDIGCERGNNAYNIVNRLENPVTREYLKTFEAIWSDKDKLPAHQMPYKLTAISTMAMQLLFLAMVLILGEHGFTRYRGG